MNVTDFFLNGLHFMRDETKYVIHCINTILFSVIASLRFNSIVCYSMCERSEAEHEKALHLIETKLFEQH